MGREEYCHHPVTMFTDVPALSSLQSVGRPTQYILPPVSHLADMQHIAVCTFANTTCTNPGLTLPGISVQPCCSRLKAPTAHLAQGTIFLASLWLMQNPAPPVANQKRTDFWRETPESTAEAQYHTPTDGNAGTPALMSGQTQTYCHPSPLTSAQKDLLAVQH